MKYKSLKDQVPARRRAREANQIIETGLSHLFCFITGGLFIMVLDLMLQEGAR